MLLDPALGYYDEGLNLTEADLYRQARSGFGDARTLPPASYRSKVFSSLEDNRLWARTWIAIGVEQEIAGPGDLLPFTIGYHGIHLQRDEAGALVGRFNKAQHGGCRTVPLQCQSGSRTRCSFTSCGYSRDRDVIPAGELDDDRSAAQQYLGLVPERLLPVRVATWGALLFACLDPRSAPLEACTAPLRRELPLWLAETQRFVGKRWFAIAANWKLIAPTLRDYLAPNQTATPSAGADFASAGAVEHWPLAEIAPALPGIASREGALSLLWCYPNLLLMTLAEETLVILLQPLSMSETQVRVLLMRANASPDDLDAERLEAWIALLDAAMAAARAEQQVLATWGTPSRPETDCAHAPIQQNVFARQFQDYLIGRILEEDETHGGKRNDRRG